MGEMKRAIAREEPARTMEDQKRVTDRFTSTLVIAASIIAAVRLARDQDHQQAVTTVDIRHC